MTRKQKTVLTRIIVGAVFFAAGMILRLLKTEGVSAYISAGLFIASLLVAGYDVILKAGRNILKGRVFDENFLMVIATIGAVCIGEYPEGAGVMLFYQIGELFQSIAVGKSRKSISALMELRPDYANVKRGDSFEAVDPYEVEIGDIIMIKPGEKVPLDAVVIEGSGAVDTSALTGESVPRTVRPGDEILSGSINRNGVLTAEVEKDFDGSTASKILELVENAAENKSKSESFITRFARWYTPAVVIAALIIAVVPPLLIENADFKDWIYRALTFLVISCPCALVVSVPLSFFSGIGKCSRSGVLVKGSNFLELLAKPGAVVFDKTGTLTKGNFTVTGIYPNGVSEEELVETAAVAESFSSHPISVSLRDRYGKTPDPSRLEDYIEIPGHGIKAVADGKKILVGNESLMKIGGIDYIPCEDVGTVVYVSSDEAFLGAVVISDEIKPCSREAVDGLKAVGVERMSILTGDNRPVAEDIGRRVGISEVYSDLLPQHKVKKIEEIKEQLPDGNNIIFVGDGINDAPSLAVSDVGVAMGGVGSDAAVEAADAVIMNDDPTKLAPAIGIARKTLRIAKENIVFALSVKLAVLALGALGVAPMWLAVFADVGVAVLAILNAMRV